MEKLYKKLKSNLFLIGGPCVIENEKMVFNTASKLKEITERLGITFVFKASYDKANRTSIKSFRGPGLKKGLNILLNVKEKLNIPILTDVHSPEEAISAAKIVDIIQIPAFLCRQTDLLITAGKTGKCVNIKKAQFLSPESIKYIIEKLEYVNCKEILVTERGSSFGYGSLVVDFLGIPIMRKFGYPLIFDATHSVQRPSTGAAKTGGFSEGITTLLYAAIAAGIDGIFMEIHPNPKKALSDQESQFPLDKVEKVLKKSIEIYKSAHNN